jgi:membrane protease YdiL (CAAX protease family)
LELLAIGTGVGAVAAILLHAWPPPFRSVSFARPSPLVALGVIIGLAVANALLEEALWRILVYRILISASVPGLLAVIIQAIGFGLAHRAGLPGGLSGMVGAGAFGMLQGVLRLRGRTLWDLVLIHAVVDGIIFLSVWQSWLLFGANRFGP